MKEMSRNMLQRLAEQAPDKLLEEVERNRSERDALRDSLSFKMVEHIRKLELKKTDVLVIRGLEKTGDALLEVVQNIQRLILSRTGWEGPILVEKEPVNVGLLSDDEAKKLYESLKLRFA